MFERFLAKHIKEVAKTFPGLLLTGPRQSGKTTLLRHLFPTFEYVLLESPDVLLELRSDPRFFLEKKVQGWIFDEAQLFPELFSYLQGYMDAKDSKPVLLTGSQNFLLTERISQSLAGRVAVLELLPLSIKEIRQEKKYRDIELFELMFSGLYPRPYHENLPTGLWYQSYIQTYLERDVRQISQIGDLAQFQLFLKLCAGRTGQILNLESLGADCGISQPTAKRWLSILESSRIVFLLQPHHENFRKRLVKRPKLYFFDTSIICGLLGIHSKEQLMSNAIRGAIFESLIISEFAKTFFNKTKSPPLFFWRDHRGLEIDCVIDSGGELSGIEIKSSKTLSQDFADNVLAWSKIARPKGVSIVYGGTEAKRLKDISVFPWHRAHEICSI
jgi:uncharacterized protein